MRGFGVNTYKMVNADGPACWSSTTGHPKQGIRSLTQAEADKITNFNHATQDLYDAIERGDFPEWELSVQIMDDGEHPELDFDPLDATKIWPEDQFPLRPVGRMVLDRNPVNYFAEVEQVAFGTGVLVDGLDFSDDKLLQGRTFSYSDTQRYRVGPNYLQLPINPPKTQVATNQRDGQMTYHVDGDEAGANPHVNYEPSTRDGLARPRPRRAAHAIRLRQGRPPEDQPHQQLRPGRRALPHLRAVGAGRADLQPGLQAFPVQPGHPGADGLACSPSATPSTVPASPKASGSPSRIANSSPPATTTRGANWRRAVPSGAALLLRHYPAMSSKIDRDVPFVGADQCVCSAHPPRSLSGPVCAGPN